MGEQEERQKVESEKKKQKKEEKKKKKQKKKKKKAAVAGVRSIRLTAGHCREELDQCTYQWRLTILSTITAVEAMIEDLLQAMLRCAVPQKSFILCIRWVDCVHVDLVGLVGKPQ